MKRLVGICSGIALPVCGLLLLFLTGCAQTLQYPPFPDQAKRIEDPAKARIYVLRSGGAYGAAGPIVIFGSDRTATGPTFDPSQKFVEPLFGVLPDNYNVNKAMRRIGEVGPKSYICWETPPHSMAIQRVEGDSDSTYTIDLQAGSVYYFRAHVRPGWIENKFIVEEMPEDQALKLLKECKPPNSYRK
jgi:hypothetical protein